MNFTSANLLAVLALLTIPIPAPTLAQGLPDHLELRYSWHYGNIKLGATKKELKLKSDRYILTSHTQAEGLGKLIDNGLLQERGEFKVDGQTVVPLRYEQARTGKKAYQRQVTFDWQDNTLVYGNGHKEKLPKGTQDSGSLFFALMLQSGEELDNKTVHVTNGRRLSHYRYTLEGTEPLHTPIGTLNTRRIMRSKPGRKETVTVWLATDRHNLPVKIVKQREGRPATILLIESVVGL
ncbi:MAG TPA: DUF3108 domain-containing protein [Gammaproteobacteria bacterium]|nr:DUF3108 domain-containing protein [Gammaproteobacteria bacterium]